MQERSVADHGEPNQLSALTVIALCSLVSMLKLIKHLKKAYSTHSTARVRTEEHGDEWAII